MNKYSKRALKTTATVGMSLAMVLSAAAPVMAAYDVPNVTTGTGAENFLGTLNDYLAANGIDYTGIQVGVAYDGTTFLTFTDSSGVITNSLEAESENALKFFNYKTDEAEYGQFDYLAQLAEKLNTMAVTATGVALSTISDGKITSAADEKSLIGILAKAIDDVETEEAKDAPSASALKTLYAAVSTALEEVIKVEAYEGALPDAEIATGAFDMYSKENYVAIKELAQEMVDEYFGNTYDSTLKSYVKTLKDGYKNFFTPAGVAAKKTSKQIAAQIKTVTNTPDYKRYVGEDVVDSIIENYNEMLYASKEVETVITTKYEATVALMKTQAKYDGTTKETLSTYIGKNDAAEVIKLIDSELFEIIKDYKEEVLDMILDLDTEKVGKTYFDATTKSPFAPDTTITKLVGYLAAKDSSEELGLLDIADDSTGVRFYDQIADRMTEVQKELTKVTTAIKGISVNNLSSANIGKVNDAYKAIKNLSKDGKYAGNLTSDEADTVEDQKEFVEMLRTYALLNGIVSGTTTGWVDLGNGNWDFYLENGDAPTKWVAAGSDWFFVQNGHMLRNSWVAKDATGAVWYYVDNAGKMVSNTTIGGYAINANGEWHK